MDLDRRTGRSGRCLACGCVGPGDAKSSLVCFVRRTCRPWIFFSVLLRRDASHHAPAHSDRKREDSAVKMPKIKGIINFFA